MKTLREELIYFVKWYRAEWSIPEYIKDEYSIDDYLFEKSNNSSTAGGMRWLGLEARNFQKQINDE